MDQSIGLFKVVDPFVQPALICAVSGRTGGGAGSESEKARYVTLAGALIVPIPDVVQRFSFG